MSSIPTRLETIFLHNSNPVDLHRSKLKTTLVKIFSLVLSFRYTFPTSPARHSKTWAYATTFNSLTLIILSTEHRNFHAYIVQKPNNPTSPKLKFHGSDLYLLPPSVAPCELLDTPDLQYLNQSTSPISLIQCSGL